MDLPPDLPIPPGFRVGLSPRLRRKKAIQRLWLEVQCLVNRRERTAELAAFEADWSWMERESMARRLVIREFREAHGFAAAWWVSTLKRLPRDVNKRAAIYQLNAKFNQSLAEKRGKLGLLPREKLRSEANEPI